jgi:hypothetical protein
MVLELWNGAAVKAEIAKWHIYLGWNGTSDWNRVQYIEVSSGKSLPKQERCTQVGLARWADGIIDSVG